MRIDEAKVSAHAIEPAGPRGFKIRLPDGTYYNGIWRARRMAVMACRTLNEGKDLPISHQPDRLIKDTRKARNR